MTLQGHVGSQTITTQPYISSPMRIGILMGGFSAERHISMESGRNVYEKFASSGKYTPIPIFLTGTPDAHQLFIIPINFMLKDNADDIHEKLHSLPIAPTPANTYSTAKQAIFQKYTGACISQPIPISYESLRQHVESIFIALHGRPGEDGTVQAILEEHHLPYNGSTPLVSQMTMDKYATNRFLHTHGIHVADQLLVTKAQWMEDDVATMKGIETTFPYPFITKPVDDGCSVGVCKIDNRTQLQAYAQRVFQIIPPPDKKGAPSPTYQRFLVETLIDKGTADHFLEITGGLLTHSDKTGNVQYEMLEPSEVIAQGDILSLVEKFLAGEGQNITPARFHTDPKQREIIATQVKQDLQKVAQLLQLTGYARIDAMVKIFTFHVETWIIEVNTLPALTPATCIFHQAAFNGYTPFDFLDKIIQQSYRSLQ